MCSNRLFIGNKKDYRFNKSCSQLNKIVKKYRRKFKDESPLKPNLSKSKSRFDITIKSKCLNSKLRI